MKKSLKKFAGILLFIGLYMFNFNPIHSQDSIEMKKTNTQIVAGYHFGVVQIVGAMNKGEFTFLDKYNFYTIGFPFGVTFKTPCRMLVDLEFVPVIKPFASTDIPYQVHLLYHPGVLFPLKKGWTFGLRLAFESGEGQFGFTPLLNKAFKFKNNGAFFVELVAPGRFGPTKDSGYTQLGGLHLGIGF